MAFWLYERVVQNGAAVNEANFHPNPQSRKTGGWSFPREMF